MDEKDTKKKLSEQFAQAGEAIKKAGNAAVEAADSAKMLLWLPLTRTVMAKLTEMILALETKTFRKLKKKPSSLQLLPEKMRQILLAKHGLSCAQR